jgi:hypothetical protein
MDKAAIRFRVERDRGYGRFWMRSSKGRWTGVGLGEEPFQRRSQRGTPFIVRMVTSEGTVLQEFPAASREAGKDVVDRLRRELDQAPTVAVFLEGHGVPTRLLRAAVADTPVSDDEPPKP